MGVRHSEAFAATPDLRSLRTMPPLPDSEAHRVESARHAISASLLSFGLRGTEPILIRSMSSNTVFRFGEFAAKVYPVGADVSRILQCLEVLHPLDTTAFLRSSDGTLHQTPFGHVMVFPWCEETGVASWAVLGEVLKDFHAIDAGEGRKLPRWVPLRKTEAQLARYLTFPGARPQLAEALLERRVQLLERAKSIESDLGWGIIHGDVSRENTANHKGRTRLIDLDECAFGPREYDLAGAAIRLGKGDMSEVEYEKFCKTYGHDVRDWKSLSLIKEICSLGAGCFLLGENGPCAEVSVSVRNDVKARASSSVAFF